MNIYNKIFVLIIINIFNNIYKLNKISNKGILIYNLKKII